jgi:hypothetical protein
VKPESAPSAIRLHFIFVSCFFFCFVTNLPVLPIVFLHDSVAESTVKIAACNSCVPYIHTMPRLMSPFSYPVPTFHLTHMSG